MFTCIRYCGKCCEERHTYTRWLYLPVHVIVERVVAGKGKQHPKARPQRKEHLICCIHPHLSTQHGNNYSHPLTPVNTVRPSSLIHSHLLIQYGHHHSHPPTPVNTVRPSSLTSTHTCQYSTAIITHIHLHLSIKHGHHHSHPPTPVDTVRPSSLTSTHICQ